MKVILTAFNGELRSEPMDWPEGIHHEIKMRMSMDNLKISRTELDAAVFDTRPTIGKFVPTGKYFALDKETAEEFKLIEVV